jgi:hypothetical protein
MSAAIRGRRSRDEAGAVVILVAVLSVTMFTLVALVVDLGMARVVRRQAQVASDASSLAAATALYAHASYDTGAPQPDFAAAVTAAKGYAAENYQVVDTDWAGCTDPAALAYQPAGTPCISFDDATKPTQVRIVVPLRNVKLPFGALAGASQVNIGASAAASLEPGGLSNCGLCIIGDGAHDVQNGEIDVSGGSVAFNGSVNVHNNGHVTASDGHINVEGTATGSTYSPAPATGQPEMPDPLATYPLPSDFSTLGAAKTDPCTQGPGLYGGHNFENGTCTLAAGLYVITGEWSFTGSAGLDAAGVTLYFTCGDTSDPRPCDAGGEDGGWLDEAGNGTIDVVAPDSGTYKGLAIAYDRLNTSQLVLNGNAASSYDGTIYAYSATMDITGNGCLATADALVVVHELVFSGTNSCLNTDYTQDANVYVPPSSPHLSE